MGKKTGERVIPAGFPTGKQKSPQARSTALPGIFDPRRHP